jgi:hypothetical protein
VKILKKNIEAMFKFFGLGDLICYVSFVIRVKKYTSNYLFSEYLLY